MPANVIPSASVRWHGRTVLQCVDAHALLRYAAPVIAVLLWQGACSAGIVSTRLVASPVQVITTGWGLLRDGTLGANLGGSLARAAAGLAIAVVLGVGLALVSGLSRLGEDIVDAPLQILRTLPALAMVPLSLIHI